MGLAACSPAEYHDTGPATQQLAMMIGLELELLQHHLVNWSMHSQWGHISPQRVKIDSWSRGVRKS